MSDIQFLQVSSFIHSVTILIISKIAKPCDIYGAALLPHAPPAPDTPPPDNPWTPFNNRNEFQFATFHFVENQSSASKIDAALDMWAAQIFKYGDEIPWKNPNEMYATIDAIQHGECPWESVKI